jgi:hypothetical protein
MAGAIVSHLTVIGIESKGDGGQLFMLAITVMVCSLVILVLHRQQGVDLYKRFSKKTNAV